MLALFFAVTAWMKFSWLRDGGFSRTERAGQWVPLVVMSLVEVAGAILLLPTRTYRWAARLVAVGFAAVGVTTLIHVATSHHATSCRCLGSVKLAASTSLVLHGILIGVASAILALAQKERGAPESHSM